jgi:hypothetical protein
MVDQNTQGEAEQFKEDWKDRDKAVLAMERAQKFLWKYPVPPTLKQLSRERLVELINTTRPLHLRGKKQAWDKRFTIPEAAARYELSREAVRYAMIMPFVCTLAWETEAIHQRRSLLVGIGRPELAPQPGVAMVCKPRRKRNAGGYLVER